MLDILCAFWRHECEPIHHARAGLVVLAIVAAVLMGGVIPQGEEYWNTDAGEIRHNLRQQRRWYYLDMQLREFFLPCLHVVIRSGVTGNDICFSTTAIAVGLAGFRAKPFSVG